MNIIDKVAEKMFHVVGVQGWYFGLGFFAFLIVAVCLYKGAIGFRFNVYRRDEQPMMYWLCVILICAAGVTSIILGLSQ